MDVYTLPNVGWMAGGKWPHGTGRSARCFVTTWRGEIREGVRETQEGGDMGIYVYV